MIPDCQPSLNCLNVISLVADISQEKDLFLPILFRNRQMEINHKDLKILSQTYNSFFKSIVLEENRIYILKIIVKIVGKKETRCRDKDIHPSIYAFEKV